MSHALTMDSQLLAQELYQLLRAIDPARWRDGVEEAVEARAQAVRARLESILASSDLATSPKLAALHERLNELSVMMEAKVPSGEIPVERMRLAWAEFRVAMVPAYEQLAASLKPLDIHVPSLRPTNYFRNVYHAANGVMALMLVQHLLTTTGALILAGGFAATAWSVEYSRRRVPAINRLMMTLFKHLAHPHEAWRVNSATWFATAMLGLAIAGDLRLITVALMVLAFGDPSAALVGRRWGRTKLVNGRSLEGTLTFVAVGTVAAMAGLVIYHPELGVAGALLVAACGAVPGGLAELFARRIDDNLAIPLAAGAGAALALGLLGV